MQIPWHPNLIVEMFKKLEGAPQFRKFANETAYL